VSAAATTVDVVTGAAAAVGMKAGKTLEEMVLAEGCAGRGRRSRRCGGSGCGCCCNSSYRMLKK
jgi:hypothetical protein